MLTWRSVKHGKAEASNTNMCSYYSKTVVFKLKKNNPSKKKASSLSLNQQALFKGPVLLKLHLIYLTDYTIIVYYFIKYIFQSFLYHIFQDRDV